MNRFILLCVTVILVLSGCDRKDRKLLFKKVSMEHSGVDFVNEVKDTRELNILDYLYFYNGGGVAAGDINNDGLTDIFFTSNLKKNRLYLNKGDFVFEDISERAGIQGASDWNSGTTMADVNGDGYLDIYVCAVVGINGFRGRNELYINNGDGTFTESAAAYGLDIDNYSSTASFFDYDNDGDLDMYLLSHAVHSINSYGPARIRNQRVYESGDKLMRNDDGVFTDVSEEAGIFGGANSYGLGLATSDFNNDGYTDIYICNDFHEDDYFYLNNGDGTFTESIKAFFGHTSRFSMGSDVSDINHDGYTDILSLDMLPREEQVLKSTDGDESIDQLTYKIENLDYHYQFTRNMLQINREGKFFSETALLSNVAATDWSWSALFADYNQDGEQDLFVFNGIPRRPNGLDFINYISNDQIRKKMDMTKLMDNEALDLMPSGAVQNVIFKGTGDIAFEDMSDQWIEKDSIISNGSAYADFDNDGDLDVVTNNLNSPPTLYRNQTNQSSSYLKIKLVSGKKNRFGIGTKAFSYNKGQLQYKQLFTTKGFQSSSEPVIHFGYGQATNIDSLRIIWPDGATQLLKDVGLNQTLVISPGPSDLPYPYASHDTASKPWFTKLSADSLGLDYIHKENLYIDFNRQKLIPYKISDKGPAIAVGDLDLDGDDDIFFGSSKRIPSKIYLQENGHFSSISNVSIELDSLTEDVDAVIRDLNDDGLMDIGIIAAGGEYTGKSRALLDKIYINKGNMDFSASDDFPEIYENNAVIRAGDYDNDGDLDLFVGGGYVANDFGKIPESFILENNHGAFSILPNHEIRYIGMVTDALWTDYNMDGALDLILVGEWMPPVFFKNSDNQLTRDEPLVSDQLNGLWQCIEGYDIDDDGDQDFILGNWGLNSKLKASPREPLKMYYDDFDDNGKTETVLATAKNGVYYPINSMNELSSQLVSIIRKKFTDYNSFSHENLEGIFSKKMLSDATLFEVHELASGYLRNDQGTFSFHPFDSSMQLAPVNNLLTYDFDGDGSEEVLSAGNFFGVIPFHGRFDSNSGNIIQKNGRIISSSKLLGLDLSNKMIRGLNILMIENKPYLLVTINNSATEIYQINRDR